MIRKELPTHGPVHRRPLAAFRGRRRASAQPEGKSGGGPARRPALGAAGGASRASPRAGSVGRLRARGGRARPLLRRRGPVPRGAALGQPKLGAAARGQGPAARDRPRRLPDGLARRGPRPGLRQPQAGARRRRPRGRAAGGRGAHLRRGGRAGVAADAAGLAQPQVRPRLDGRPRPRGLPPPRPHAGGRGDERRRHRDPAAGVARAADDGPAGAAAHGRGHGVGDGHGGTGRRTRAGG